MGQKVWLAALAALWSLEAGATPFATLDARTSAMGGAGVAAARGAAAVFVNPALLKEGREPGVVPVAGMFRFVDPQSVENELDHYQNSGYEETFEEVLAEFIDNPALPNRSSKLGEAMGDMVGQMRRFSDAAVVDEFRGGTAVDLPYGKRPMALVVGASVIRSGQLVGVKEGIARIEELREAINDGVSTDDEIFDIKLSGPDRNFDAKLLNRGAIIYEVGVALSQDVSLWGHRLVAGIVPKYVDITTFDDVQGLTGSSFTSLDWARRYSSFNVDLGVAREYEEGWRSGVVISNLIPQEYETEYGNQITIDPQVRAGVAKRSDWYTMAMDLDLNRRSPIGLGEKQQYLALGGEAELTKGVWLRAGYRMSLVESRASVVTVGGGFMLLGSAVDLSMALNEDELAMSAQFGLRF